MDARKALTNGVFCPMPWTGVMVNFDGTVKNCIRSSVPIGDLKTESIEDILGGTTNTGNQNNMLFDSPPAGCQPCYEIEAGKKKLDIISDRVFYIRELKDTKFETYQSGHHNLKAIDVRWSNLCNFACVYCGPEFSSRWAQELSVETEKPSTTQMEQFKKYVFDRAKDLKHVYLAGGEPLLMKQNLELLELLQKHNPDVNLRINTNLSKVDTKIFDMICGFKNVHWTISVETLGEEFEYVRYGGSWADFQDNLDHVSRLPHKISFNMLYFLLNYQSLFSCIDWLTAKAFHPNSFIIGALLEPFNLNIRHLPDDVLQSVKRTLMDRIDSNPGYLLEDSYRNLLRYIEQPCKKDLPGSLQYLQDLDSRRGTDSRKTFSSLYDLI